MFYTRNPFQIKIDTLKVKGWKIYSTKNLKNDAVAILISDKVDFRMRNITRDKKGY